MAYTILHTIDESGARCAAAEGWIVGEFASLDDAVAAAAALAGGYVRREDGSTLMPDGEWAVSA